ncbi:MAG: GtrA family protein [Agathobacter sp.]|nr:GtrA family protein [Agathobacter sp.]
MSNYTQQENEKRTLVDWFRDFIKFWPWAHDIFCKYEEILVYLVVGVLTTIVSWVACFVSERFFLDASNGFQNFLINTIGWVVGVCFSYPLNRSWVFKSRNPKVAQEFMMFASSRLSTWLLDIVIMWLTVNIFQWNYWVSKICVSAVVVTILNYVFSKVLIFNKKDKKNQK